MTLGTETTTGSGHDEPTMVDQVKETTGQAKEKAAETVRSQVDGRTQQAAEQVRGLADALRRTGEQLRNEGRPQPAGMIEGVADRGERLGRALEEMDGRQVLDGIEGVARRQPWLVTGAAFLGGLVASRFLKASSRARYDAGPTPSAAAGAMPTGLRGAAHGGAQPGMLSGVSRETVPADTFPPPGSVPASSIAGPSR